VHSAHLERQPIPSTRQRSGTCITPHLHHRCPCCVALHTAWKNALYFARHECGPCLWDIATGGGERARPRATCTTLIAHHLPRTAPMPVSFGSCGRAMASAH